MVYATTPVTWSEPQVVNAGSVPTGATTVPRSRPGSTLALGANRHERRAWAAKARKWAKKKPARRT